MMTGTVLNLFLLALLLTAILVLIVVPMVAMGIFFFHWKKELEASIRTRQAKTTYVDGVIRREETA